MPFSQVNYPTRIVNILLAVIFVFCLGSRAYANSTIPTGKIESTLKTGFSPCVMTASPLSHTSPGGGDDFQVNVVVLGAGCTYGVRYSEQWIQTQNRNSNSFHLTVYPNTGPLRMAQISIFVIYNLAETNEKLTLNLTQGTAVCSYSFDPSSQSFGNGNGFGYIQVTASYPFCPRNAVSDSNWLAITSGTDTNGSGPIGYSVTSNPGPVRTGKIKLGTATFTLTQGSGCNYQISPLSKNFDAAGGTGVINVTTSSPGCPRVATPVPNWITITSGSNLTGNGPIAYQVAPNPGQARTGIIKVSAQDFVVQQSGGCAFTLSPAIFNFQPGNGSSAIQVTASSESCAWSPTVSASWVKITSKPVGGTGTLYFSVDPNTGAKRSATITIGGKVATINQAANDNCTFAINPGSYQIGVGGGEVNVGVTTSNTCAWTASSFSPFISVSSGAVGAGNGPVKLNVQPNSGAPRSGSVVIAGKTFLVSQAGVDGTAAMLISSLNPEVTSAGSKEFLMTVKGSNFTNACKVKWEGDVRPTTFINGSTLVASIPASDIAQEGAFDVTVSNPNDGDETNPEKFMVYGAIANVSSASFKGESLAPASLVSAFGVDLATELKIADSQPLPTELAGTTVTITDSAAQEHQAKLFFVSAGQINYLMPETVTLGKATVMIQSGSGHTSVSTVEITQVAPALFSANSTGQGVATAIVVRVKANGQQVYEQVAQYDAGARAFIAKPIDLSVPGEQVYLAFYGSGLRYRSMLNSASVSIGGVLLNALYVGPVPGYEGLDQVNILLPNSLAGRGDVDVLLSVDGKQSNTVKLRIK